MTESIHSNDSGNSPKNDDDSRNEMKSNSPNPSKVIVERFCLFVGNIPYEYTENDIIEKFGVFGPIVKVNVPFDYHQNHNKGICFIDFENRDDADKALQEMNGCQLNSRKLRVDWDQGDEVKRRTGGGGGGRRSYDRRFDRSPDYGGRRRDRDRDRYYDRYMSDGPRYRDQDRYDNRNGDYKDRRYREKESSSGRRYDDRYDYRYEEASGRYDDRRHHYSGGDRLPSNTGNNSNNYSRDRSHHEEESSLRSRSDYHSPPSRYSRYD